ncbi:MAG: hypothetical protein QM730_27095 [Anaerolineales bacterium]
MARKQPALSTVKNLFAVSGNQCANPKCESLLTEGSTVLGEICHIEAAEEDGPRYNSKSNDEYRRSYENLVLLCPNCHTTVDHDSNSYPVSLLKSWKTKHENKERKSKFNVSNEMAQHAIEVFMKQANDNTSTGTQFNNQANTQVIGSQIGIQNNNTFVGNLNSSVKIDGARKVIPGFKAIIDKHSPQASPPDTWVIDYQNELVERVPRTVHLVETRFLRFRKENGRIKSDVKSYEKMHDVELKEEDEELKNY